MANRISNINSLNIFVILVSFIALQSTQVGATCSKIVGRCAVQNCAATCRNFPGTDGGFYSCGYFDLCTCFFDKTPPKEDGEQRPCNAGLQLCDATCDSNCCKSKCTEIYKNYVNPTGDCVRAFQNTHCICYYDM
ncbi:defensin-like protein 183 [Vicia villosa]|uniref:defensin-like protein 183 n=1 Tax=Vicia villosa TaxID=3911 RepID=UPI00273C2BA6|nr:defensin-like protein 183 [Vicia villosa]